MFNRWILVKPYVVLSCVLTSVKVVVKGLPNVHLINVWVFFPPWSEPLERKRIDDKNQSSKLFLFLCSSDSKCFAFLISVSLYLNTGGEGGGVKYKLTHITDDLIVLIYSWLLLIEANLISIHCTFRHTCI